MLECRNDIALFIGGPWDGRRRVVWHKAPQIYVPRPVKWAGLQHYGAGPQPRGVETVRYVRLCTHVGNGQILTFYMVADPDRSEPTMVDVIDALALGYRLPRERKYAAE